MDSVSVDRVAIILLWVGGGRNIRDDDEDDDTFA